MIAVFRTSFTIRPMKELKDVIASLSSLRPLIPVSEQTRTSVFALSVTEDHG